MSVPSIRPLYDSESVPEVADVAVALCIGRSAVVSYMKVAAIDESDRTAALLEVSTPGVKLRVQGTSVGTNVAPAVLCLDCRPPLVKPECLYESGSISRQSIRRDVIRA